MGLTAAVFMVVLAGTGILLNHTERLNLADRFVQSDWLLDWYGVAPPAEPVSFAAAGHWVSRLGERLYLDGAEIPGTHGRLVGAATSGETLVVALEEQILLFDSARRLIERVGTAEGIPAGMRTIGVDDRSRLVVHGAHGYYLADEDFLEWRPHAAAAVHWSKPQPTPAALRDKLIHAYRGKGLSVERVLLDIHSGRILGSVGMLLVDSAALLGLLLAVSGTWLWTKRKCDVRGRS